MNKDEQYAREFEPSVFDAGYRQGQRDQQVRIEELEEKAEHWHQRWENRNEHVDLISCDRDALKAQLRVEVVHCGEFQQRVEVLTAALTDALDGMEEMLPYVPEYFVDKHALNRYIPRARAALATGKTESEAP